MGQPSFSTRDVAARLKISVPHASQLLGRLQNDHILMRMKSSRWILVGQVDSFSLAKYLAFPLPTYVSLLSALFHHRMISQIPETVFAVTLGRTKQIKTPLGSYSLHHVKPEFFFGFSEVGSQGALIADPEKALLDVFYLSGGRSRIFSHLPEVELPKSFSFKKCREMIKKIESKRLRAIVTSRLAALPKA